MNGYLIAEEGPLAGSTIAFEEGADKNEWVLGRDPDSTDIVLEDPMVSRRHAIVRLTPEGFILENLSSVNPALQNGMVIADPVLLKEGDIIQIGSTFFNFTEKAPETATPPASFEKPLAEAGPAAEMPSEIHFGPHSETRWMLKVISGPNAGAEFAMTRGSTYLIGKDPNICDIVFQDLSVSRQHARLTVDDQENVYIEDLGSRNGVIVNGELISNKQLLSSQDLVALGTTTFVVVDRREARETIVSPALALPQAAPKKVETTTGEKRNWKEMIIPKRHLFVAAILCGTLFISIFAAISLFKTEHIVVKEVDDTQKIHMALSKFSGVKFSYNAPTGKLFLIGHVMTSIEHQELNYLIKTMPMVHEVEDNVIVDELVWQNMNSLLATNPNWVGVSLYSREPGRFVLRGYLATPEEASALSDYIHLNFDYLDKLENQVVIEKNLQMDIERLLIEKGLAGSVTYELANGEVVLSGRIDRKHEQNLDQVLHAFRNMHGIRIVKNYVAIGTPESMLVDLSGNYAVTGYSKRDEKDYYVVINGRILSQGDMLDGMHISKIQPKSILLEKEGVHYKINYNLQ